MRVKFGFAVPLMAFFVTGTGGSLVQAADQIVHDAEYYVLEAQHGKEWAAEDIALQAKLDELKKKHGRPPNLIHIMWTTRPMVMSASPPSRKFAA